MQPNNQPGWNSGQSPQGPQPGDQPPTGYTQPKAHNHVTWIIAIVALSLLVLTFAGFGIWAFTERDTYKNQTQSIVDDEVTLALQSQKSDLENEFLEREKEPLTTYTGPSQFGSLKFDYPKTWSAYVDESGDGTVPVSAYLHPDFVPAIDSGTAFALRVEVLEKTYDDVLGSFDSDVKNGAVSITPFRLPSVESVLGSRVEGEIARDKQGVMIVMPLRDKTLQLSTQAQTFRKDFEEIIIPNFEFTP